MDDEDLDNYLTATWNAVSGATDYRVGLKYGNSLLASQVTADPSYVVSFSRVYDLIGDSLGITVEVVAYVGGFDTLPAEIDVTLREPHPAPSVSIESQTTTSVTLEWTNVNYGTSYAGAVVGWVYVSTRYLIFSGPSAGFDPVDEGTLVDTLDISAQNISHTMNLDLTEGNTYYLKIAAAWGGSNDPAYLSFASVTVTGG